MALSIQKANFWKRISAYLFDFVIAIVLTLALSLITHTIFKVDTHIAKLNSLRAQYAADAGIDLDISTEEYQAMTEAEKSAYDEKYKAVNKAMSEDDEVLQINAAIITSVLGSFSVSIFCSTLILHFILPLFFKYGRSLGKKLFGLAVIRTSGVKISTPVLFIRSMIGLYAIETMFPLLILVFMLFKMLDIVGVIVLLAFAVLQIWVLYRTPTNSSIHDLLTDSVVVDMASQRIYESNEALLAIQQEAENAASTEKR